MGSGKQDLLGVHTESADVSVRGLSGVLRTETENREASMGKQCMKGT